MYSAPWFRKHDGWWYCYKRDGSHRSQIKLAKGKESLEEAHDRWHALCTRPQTVTHVSNESAVSLIDVFLDWCQKNRSQGTYDIYRHHLESFARHVGPDLLVHELKPRQVTAWLDAAKWSDSTKAGAVQTVRTAFRWLLREGYIPTNPVAAAKGPAKRGREVILTPAQYQAVLDNSRPDFRLLVTFLRRTGSRPQEAVKVEARHVDLSQQRIVFPPSESKGKRHPRAIYLDAEALEIVVELVAKHPLGPIFRTSRGRPWDRNNVRCRFRRLKDKVGFQFCAYHLRHTFATSALQSVDPITLASLMGHADASTIAKNYQHVALVPAHMQQAARKATGEGV